MVCKRLLGLGWLLLFAETIFANQFVIDGSSELCSDDIGTPFCTVQAAVNFAATGDELKIAPGTYPGNLHISKSVSLIGQEGVILDGQGKSAVIIINPAVDVVLEQLVITGGKAKKGGGIYNLGNLIIRGCRIEYNTAEESGGGIYSAGSMSASLVIEDSRINNNAARGDDEFNIKFGGGGIFSDAPMLIKNSDISHNIALEDGGAIYSSFTYRRDATQLEQLSEEMGVASKPITHTALNTTLQRDKVRIINTMIANNSADYGGGIYVLGTLDLRNSRIIHNSATSSRLSSGGGLFAHFNAGLTLVNSIVAHNQASSRGGGIRYYSAHDSDIYNTTIISNKVDAHGFGAGVFVQKGSALLRLQHSVIAENVKNDKPGHNCYGPLHSNGNNFLSQNRRCELTIDASDIVSTEKNAISSGIADITDDGNYRLAENSVLIDAGNEKGCAGPEGIPPSSDINHKTRIADGNKDGNARCDIGALEQQ